MSMEIDRRTFIASLGGAAAVSQMSHEARADVGVPGSRRGGRR
jgi:hypothetical protein